MFLAGILGLCMLLAAPAWAPGKSMRGSGLAYVFAQESSPVPSGQGSSEQDASRPVTQPTAKPDSQQPSGQPSGNQQKPQSSNQARPAPSQAGETTSTQKPPGKTPAPKAPPTQGTSSSPDPGTKKTVVRHGSTAEPVTQLSPGISQQQAAQQRQRIQQALASTDANLQKLSATQLTPDRQETVGQIRKFMQQSKEASKSGDLQRAENLAQKAQLLSNDLVKK